MAARPKPPSRTARHEPDKDRQRAIRYRALLFGVDGATTFLTGKQPGKHGVFCFQNFDPYHYSGFSETLVDSSYFRGQTLRPARRPGDRPGHAARVQLPHERRDRVQRHLQPAVLAAGPRRAFQPPRRPRRRRVRSLFNWFPTCLPLLTAGFVESGIETPWRLRLSAALDRRLIRMLAPRASDVVTIYGGPATPMRLATVPLHVRQTLRQCGHLAAKLDTVLGSGRLFRRWFVPSRAPARKDHILTLAFRDFLTPEKMRSRGCTPCRVCDACSPARTTRGRRAATIEQLCRELRFEPGPDYLTVGS